MPSLYGDTLSKLKRNVGVPVLDLLDLLGSLLHNILGQQVDGAEFVLRTPHAPSTPCILVKVGEFLERWKSLGRHSLNLRATVSASSAKLALGITCCRTGQGYL